MSDCMEAISVSNQSEKTVTGREKLCFSGFEIIFQNSVSDVGKKIVFDNNNRIINKSCSVNSKLRIVDIEKFFCFQVFRKFINPKNIGVKAGKGEKIVIFSETKEFVVSFVMKR